MARVKLAATTETKAVVEVKLQPQARQMLVTRGEEHSKLAKEIAERKGRQERIREECETIFKKEKQGKALLNGTKVADYGFKLVTGKRKVFDQMGFMKKHGLTQADFDEFTEEVDNEPYVKISAPSEKKEKE